MALLKWRSSLRPNCFQLLYLEPIICEVLPKMKILQMYHIFLPAASFTLRLHSALCAGQCASWQTRPQEKMMQQPAHFLRSAPLHPGLAQWMRATKCAVRSAAPSKYLERSTAVPKRSFPACTLAPCLISTRTVFSCWSSAAAISGVVPSHVVLFGLAPKSLTSKRTYQIALVGRLHM
jgi:hypothetical protein